LHHSVIDPDADTDSEDEVPALTSRLVFRSVDTHLLWPP
jgi:hypothetical protein